MNDIQTRAHKPGGRAVAWLFVSLLMLIILTSCNPYVETPTVTPTARPTSTPMPNADPVQIVAQGTPTPSPTCTVRTGIPAGTVNLRTGAGVSNSVLRVLSEGEILKVLSAQRAAWLKVIDTRGNRGFIYRRYCQ